MPNASGQSNFWTLGHEGRGGNDNDIFDDNDGDDDVDDGDAAGDYDVLTEVALAPITTLVTSYFNFFLVFIRTT